MYGDWGNFSECSVTCGKGIKFRTRSCAGECKDPTTEYEDCDMGCCPGMGSCASELILNVSTQLMVVGLTG